MSDYQSRNTTSGTEAVGGSVDSGTSGSGSSNSGSAGMMQRATDMMNQARDYVTDKVGDLGGQVSNLSGQLNDQMHRGYDRMMSGMDSIRNIDRDDVSQVYDDMMESARRNPGRTILISAAVGMVLGMMLRGGERRY